MPDLLHVDNEETLTGNLKPSLTPGKADGEITIDDIWDYLGESEKLVFTFNVEAVSSKSAYRECEEVVIDMLDTEYQELQEVHNETLKLDNDDEEDLYIIAIGVVL